MPKCGRASRTLPGYPCLIAARAFPKDKLKEVFELFFTSKAEGMGMGLSIARTTIEAHHGLISGRKSGSRWRVVPDQASSSPIVSDPWHDPHEVDPTSANGT